MKHLTKISILTLLVLLAAPASAEHRAIDVVICLDVSGSMQYLLESARARIWDVVAELGRLELSAELRVGLVVYGTSWSNAEDGWLVVASDLTHDLDAVYAELMAVEIGGSEERVARAVETAVETLAWSPHDDALKILFVAGNERADQGSGTVGLTAALEGAREHGILVNALFAGSREQAVVEGWPAVAELGRGNFSAIDPQLGTIQVPTPQDSVLLELNDRLNQTYLPYGARGRDGFANQVAQDLNASRLGVESCSSRIVAKGSALYDNASWDLVDATLDAAFRWQDLSDEDLPEELRELSQEERIAYVEGKRREREAIQLAIQEASAEREVYLREAMARGEGDPDLGQAMRRAIREQVRKSGFAGDP